ncbi:MAG: HAD hydrolase-like protein [Clostridia bacterium]|nr:HAD hydrolase-like protein [Clostridia bacterium]
MAKLPDYCIWDFNGTILDDVGVGIASVNYLLRERGLPIIENEEAYRRVFRFPIRDYYAGLGFDFSKEPYEVIAPLWVDQYMQRIGSATLYDGVREALEGFRSLGIRQTVLSATEKEMLRGQLVSLGIEDFFEEILGLDNIHAASKTALARDWRIRHPDASAIFVGDTDHDYETASMMRAECYLITGGHQSTDYLEKMNVPLFQNVSEFYKYVCQIQ